jgi:hypothetical protein
VEADGRMAFQAAGRGLVDHLQQQVCIDRVQAQVRAAVASRSTRLKSLPRSSLRSPRHNSPSTAVARLGKLT